MAKIHCIEVDCRSLPLYPGALFPLEQSLPVFPGFGKHWAQAMTVFAAFMGTESTIHEQTSAISLDKPPCKSRMKQFGEELELAESQQVRGCTAPLARQQHGALCSTKYSQRLQRQQQLQLLLLDSPRKPAFPRLPYHFSTERPYLGLCAWTRINSFLLYG